MLHMFSFIFIAFFIIFICLILLYSRILYKVDWGKPWINYIMGFNFLFCRYYHKFSIKSGDINWHLPNKGPALLVANHQTGLDSLFLLAISPRPIRFIIDAGFYNFFGLKWFFKAIKAIPVTVKRTQISSALNDAKIALHNGEVIALYPFGGFHLPHQTNKKIKRGVAVLAMEFKIPIIPVYLQDMRCQGTVFLSLFLPTFAKITILSKILYDTQEDILHKLEYLLSNC